MKFSVTSKAPTSLKSGLIALGVPAKDGDQVPTFTGSAAEANDASDGAVARAFKGTGFTGAKAQTHVVDGWGDVRLLLVGLGKKDKIDLEVLRRAAAAAVRRADKMETDELHLAVHGMDVPEDIDHEDQVEAVVIGARLAQYRFETYKSKKGKDDGGDGKKDEPSVREVVVLTDGVRARGAKKTVTEAAAIAEAVWWSRDLANTPGNIATPDWMAKQAKQMAKKVGLTCKVLGVPDMKRMKMGGILAVGQGSEEQPRMVVLEHKPKRVRAGPYKTVVLVGKGITFDSGGITIKPGPAMDEMKFDKCGACSVIATMQAVAELDIPVHVVGIAGLAENMPGGRAYKPGDVISMANGKTVEVLNTDAEGRMVLADALWYAHRYEPDAIIDIATLTGAIDVALGSHYAGLMGSDDELIDLIEQAGKRSGERVWHLPLGEEYQEQIKGTYGDIQNIGGRGGGALTAGQFLRNFVEEDQTAWAHLDVAAVAWGDKDNGYTPKGARGTMVRMFLTFLRGLS